MILRTGTVTSAVLANSAAVLAVAGGLLYGLIALGYDRFYRTLGIAPADVGLTQVGIVARTAIALAVFLAILAGLYVVTFAALSWLLPRRDTATVALAALAALAVLGPAGLAVTVAPVLFTQELVGTTITVMIVVCAAAAAHIWLRRFATTATRRRALRIAWIGLFAWLYVVIIQFSTARMSGLADRVLAGQPIPPAGLSFAFEIHADPVCIRPLPAPDAPAERAFYALFLGAADDWITYYKPSEARTIRRARDGLELSFIPSSAGPVTCP